MSGFLRRIEVAGAARGPRGLSPVFLQGPILGQHRWRLSPLPLTQAIEALAVHLKALDIVPGALGQGYPGSGRVKDQILSKGPKSTGAWRGTPARSVGTSGSRLPKSSQGVVAVGAKVAGSWPTDVGKAANQVGSLPIHPDEPRARRDQRVLSGANSVCICELLHLPMPVSRPWPFDPCLGSRYVTPCVRCARE
jgi:hypothetical protein